MCSRDRSETAPSRGAAGRRWGRAVWGPSRLVAAPCNWDNDHGRAPTWPGVSSLESGDVGGFALLLCLNGARTRTTLTQQ